MSRMIIKAKVTCFLLLIIAVVSGCATSSQQQLLATDESQVQLRSIQTRAFDTTDKEKTMRTIISTMQDLDFVIEKADYMLGSISGSKSFANQLVKMTVTVRPRGETQLLVRANAQYGIKAVETPEQYQDFFIALEKAMFLTAQQVD